MENTPALIQILNFLITPRITDERASSLKRIIIVNVVREMIHYAMQFNCDIAPGKIATRVCTRIN